MKVLCETHVLNRQTQSKKTPRPVKATLVIGMRQVNGANNEADKKVMELVHFTPQCKAGTRYKIYKNVENLFTRFVQDGRATVSFVQPSENLMIKCDPIQLRSLLDMLKMGVEGKVPETLRLNVAASTAVKSVPQTKMAVLERSEYPIKGFPRSLEVLTISGIKLLKISSDVFTLRNLNTLDLSFNSLTKIPTELGKLSLQQLHLNNNELGVANTWKWLSGAQLKKSLRRLDLSNNKLEYFPAEICKLENLVTLKLNNNRLRRLPFAIRRLKNLRFLHVASNELESLPASFDSSHLDTLDLWENNFKGYQVIPEKLMPAKNKNTQITPLWLLAARVVHKQKLHYSNATLPLTLVDVLAESPICRCGKLCYAETVYRRAALVKFDNIRNLIFSRDRLIYADIVLCGADCLGLRMMN